MPACCPNAGSFLRARRSALLKAWKRFSRISSAGKRLPQEEDIHFAIERELIRRIGPVEASCIRAQPQRSGGFGLKALSAGSDQLIELEISDLQRASFLSRGEYDVIMPALPMCSTRSRFSFSHHILAYAWMLERDKGRLRDAWETGGRNASWQRGFGRHLLSIDRTYVAKLLVLAA